MSQPLVEFLAAIYRSFDEDVTATRAREEVEWCFVVSQHPPKDAHRRTILRVVPLLNDFINERGIAGCPKGACELGILEQLRLQSLAYIDHHAVISVLLAFAGALLEHDEVSAEFDAVGFLPTVRQIFLRPSCWDGTQVATEMRVVSLSLLAHATRTNPSLVMRMKLEHIVVAFENTQHPVSHESCMEIAATLAGDSHVCKSGSLGSRALLIEHLCQQVQKMVEVTAENIVNDVSLCRARWVSMSTAFQALIRIFRSDVSSKDNYGFEASLFCHIIDVAIRINDMNVVRYAFMLKSFFERAEQTMECDAKAEESEVSPEHSPGECAVCMEAIPSTESCVLKCQHVFCRSCVKRHIYECLVGDESGCCVSCAGSRSPACPLCRSSITVEQWNWA